MGNSVSYLADSFTYVKKTVRYIVMLPLKYMSKEEQEMANSGVGKEEEGEGKPLHLKQRQKRDDYIKSLFTKAGGVGMCVAVVFDTLRSLDVVDGIIMFMCGGCLGAICGWGAGYISIVCLDTMEYCMVPIYLKGVELIANDTEKVDISKCWKKRKEWRDEVGLRWALKIEAIDKWAESDNKGRMHTYDGDYPWSDISRQANAHWQYQQQQTIAVNREQHYRRTGSY